MNSFQRTVRWTTTPGDPGRKRRENMAITLPSERDALVEKLAVAYAFLWFRAAHGGGYPRVSEVKTARQKIASDPACAKLCAPSEGECAALLRQHGFEPPVVRRVKKT